MHLRHFRESLALNQERDFPPVESNLIANADQLRVRGHALKVQLPSVVLAEQIEEQLPADVQDLDPARLHRLPLTQSSASRFAPRRIAPGSRCAGRFPP